MHLRRAGSAVVLTCLLTLAACASKPATWNASNSSSGSTASSGKPGTVAANYVCYGEPRGAPIPDLTADGFAGVRKLPSETSRLVGTSYALSLAEVAVATTITPEQQVALGVVREGETPPSMVAAGGHEFVVTQLGPSPESATTADPSDVVWTLRVGTESRAMPKNFGSSVTGTFLEGMTIIASVPVGAETTLAAAESGKTQTISLRTGKAATGTSSAALLTTGKANLYTEVRITSPDVHIDAFPPVPENHISLNLELTAATQLNTGGHPTAKPGRAWLVVDAKALSSDDKATTVSLQLDKALKLRAAGTALTIPSDSTIITGNVSSGAGDLDAVWTFDVPRDLKSVQITYHFAGKVEEAESGGNVTWQMVSGGSSTATMTLR